jgi:hypothetical protein
LAGADRLALAVFGMMMAVLEGILRLTKELPWQPDLGRGPTGSLRKN